jgi:hypothetical protein
MPDLRSAKASRKRACSVFILDKGKPVARLGRKTKGHSWTGDKPGHFRMAAWLPKGCWLSFALCE